MAEAWPFGDLPRGAFDLILADNPWRFETWDPEQIGRTPRRHYVDMSREELEALPVAELGKRNSLLVFWGTWPKLPECLGLIYAWGYVYSTGLPWLKLTSNGYPAPGTGMRVQGYSEYLILARRGRPKTTRMYRGLVESPQPPYLAALRREHSRKPDEVRDWCRGLLARRGRLVELFARSRAPGWEAWGNEIDKFGEGKS